MNEFVYSYPTKVYFGEGAAKKHLPDELKKYGKTVLMAYGSGSVKKNGVYNELCTLLNEAGKTVIDFPGIMPNPTYAKVQEGVKFCREKGVDFILAVGGGSTIDCCKVVSKEAGGIPMGAVVTASGTGAEMNNGAVITNEETKVKGPMWGSFYDFAILDPAYTLSLPMKQVISGAFDTLSHCMETYFGMGGADNLSDKINEAVMISVIENIRALLHDEGDMNARSELEWASAMAENGILKIGKVTDFQGHQIEHQLGAYTDCNHGQGLAVIHPALYRHIYKEAVPRFARFAKMVWGVSTDGKTEDEMAAAGIDALAAFIKEIGLPTTFSEMGITDEGVLRSVADTCNLTAGCCKKLDRDEIFELLKECL